MANALNADLDGKTVIFKQEHLTVPSSEYPYRVEGGFGAAAGTRGSALMGEFVTDGERARMEGWMVERLATDDEIAAAEAKRAEGERG